MDERRRLPDAELEVMQALWSQTQYPVTTAELLPRLAEHRWQTATLLKLLSRLEDRATALWLGGRNISPLRAGPSWNACTGGLCPALWPPSWRAGASQNRKSQNWRPS